MTNYPSTLKILGRDEAPPLTDTAAWRQFPVDAYDVVIIDSFDSAAEGVGEQDSAKPSRALAAMLDVARKDGGPAFLILGNTIRTAGHSRGSGVIEDRADIVYEVRDATDFVPSGTKPWIEELPAAGASDWKGRSTRRKMREKYRLAFVSTKFRVGQEPEPFILEVDHSAEPWTVRDATDEVDHEGAEARRLRDEKQRQKEQEAAQDLAQEVRVRFDSGDPMKRRTDAEPFLTNRGMVRSAARKLIDAFEGRLWRTEEQNNLQGKPKVLIPLSGSISQNTLHPARTNTARSFQPEGPGDPANAGAAKRSTHETPENIDPCEPAASGPALGALR